MPDVELTYRKRRQLETRGIDPDEWLWNLQQGRGRCSHPEHPGERYMPAIKFSLDPSRVSGLDKYCKECQRRRRGFKARKKKFPPRNQK